MDYNNDNNQAVGLNNKKQLIATLAVLVVVVVIVGAVVASGKSSANTTATTSSAPTDSSSLSADSASAGSTSAGSSNSTSTSSSSASFKDGSYKASGNYDTPGGQESITVSITLKDGLITDTSAAASGNDRESVQYQQSFIKAYKQLVVGKKIDSISLSRVSGSSLTSQGFNDAIQTIQNQAKA